MRIVAIIPSTCSENKIPLLKSCLKSLSAKHPKNILLKTVVVSNYKNNSKNISRLKPGEVYFVSKNQGFGEMNNFAAEKAINLFQPDYILFINDDAWVGENFFNNLSKLINSEKPDIVIPLIYKEDGHTIDSFGLKYFSSGYSSTVGNLTAKTKFVSGSCFLVKRNFFEKILKKYGYFFNPLLYFYYEDTELSIRAINTNGRIIQSKNINVFHHGSDSRKENEELKYYYSFRNLLWLIIMIWPKSLIIKNIIKILFFQILVFVMLTLKFGVDLYFKIIRETRNNFRFLLHQRKIYQKDPLLVCNFKSQIDKHIFCTKKGMCI